ncbi:MAG: tetratricopeptide repeat protein [Gammaproteobacteria bacterium]|nr:tetratricopeptide repeat protein [Gammaproteobacteria bacterium]
MPHISPSHTAPMTLLLLLVLSGAVYWSGLQGGFLFDDTINITDNPKVLIDGLNWRQLHQAATSFGGGGLERPISMLTLGVNHALTGLDPFYFKLTNLAIHWLCGVGLWWLTCLLLTAYRLCRRAELTDREITWLSLAVAAAWLLHPFNLTGVLYIVQRMASLAALFMIFGLALYTWGRLRQLRGQRGAACMLIGLVVFGGLATFSKENGILLPILIFLVEWLIFGFQAPDASTRRFVIGFNVSTVLIPGVLALGVLAARFDWLMRIYETRDFTLGERLLTQARVLWFYIEMVLLPDPTRMGLYHDDIILSKNWLDPLATLPAVLGLFSLLTGSIALRRRAPLLTFGVWFFCAGHLLESTILPLEIAHEHRNYLPAYGLLFLAIYYLGHRRVRERVWLRTQAAFIVVLILALSAGTAVRASYWANDVDLALVEVRHHPHSARTNMQAGRIFFSLADHGIEPEHNFQRARQYFEIAQQLDNYNLSGSFALLVLDDRQQRPVDTDLLEGLAGKLADLPLSSASINALIHLSRCQSDGPCKFSPEVFNRLFQAILQNPTLRGRPRAQVLAELTQFAISQNALGIALYLTYQALQIAPDDPQILLNHAHLLIQHGELDAARQMIAQARALDRDAFLATRIRQQEELLERATAGQR